MEVIRSPEQMRRWTIHHRSDSRTVGLVPTMGALHEGHLSLARASVSQCDATIASIFVNPTQFGPHEDLEQYPRTLERDLELLDAEGVAAVFVPDNAFDVPGWIQHLYRTSRSRQILGGCLPARPTSGV